MRCTPRCLDPDTNFPFARQRSHSCFTKRPLIQRNVCSASTLLEQSGDARFMATIHDDLNRFLLHHGNKWPPRFVQRGTQHSFYARYNTHTFIAVYIAVIIYSNFSTKFPPTPKHKQPVTQQRAPRKDRVAASATKSMSFAGNNPIASSMMLSSMTCPTSSKHFFSSSILCSCD